jgi:hypothetical protein
MLFEQHIKDMAIKLDYESCRTIQLDYFNDYAFVISAKVFVQ